MKRHQLDSRVKSELVGNSQVCKNLQKKPIKICKKLALRLARNFARKAKIGFAIFFANFHNMIGESACEYLLNSIRRYNLDVVSPNIALAYEACGEFSAY